MAAGEGGWADQTLVPGTWPEADRALAPGPVPETDRTRVVDLTQAPDVQVVQIPHGGGDLTPELLETPVWTEAMLARPGSPSSTCRS